MTRKANGRSPKDDLPYPESGYLPALQRTLKEKFDKGDRGGIDKEEFLKQLGKTAEPRSSEES